MEGVLVAIDGIDGSGKGVVEDAIVKHESSLCKKVFDCVSYWKKHNHHPPFEKLLEFDIITTAEPTYWGVGKFIRETLINNNSKPYSPCVIAEAYSLDRLILLETLTLPLLSNGKTIIQSRCLASTLIYQTIQSPETLTEKEILDLPGNKFSIRTPPNLLIIPIINAETAKLRLAKRNKKDDAQFENLEFQLRIKPKYESKNLKNFFEKLGTKVTYLDTSISLKQTQEEAVRIYTDFLQKQI